MLIRECRKHASLPLNELNIYEGYIYVINKYVF